MEMTSRKDDMNSRVVDWVASLLGGIVLVLTLYPLIYVLSASFSDPVSVTTGKVTLLPVQPTLDGYATIFSMAQSGWATGIRYSIPLSVR